LRGKGLRIGVASAAAGLLLAVGGLFFGGALVSAQEPTPTPQQQERQTPAPRDGGQDQDRRDHECDKDGDGQPDAQGQGSSTGIHFRGGGPRGLRQ